MRTKLTIALALCLLFCACDRTGNEDPTPDPNPQLSEMPEVLLGTWTVYQLTMAVDYMEVITPAEIIGEPYYFTFYKEGLATFATDGEDGLSETIYTYHCSKYAESSMEMRVGGEDVVFDCSYELLDDDHMVLKTVNTNAKEPAMDGDWVVSYYNYLLVRGKHPEVTFAGAATPEQLAEYDIPEPAATDPLKGTSWRFESVSWLYDDGEEERMTAQGLGMALQLNFNKEGNRLSATQSVGELISQTFYFTYTYNPEDGNVTFGDNELFEDGPHRVVRQEDRLRLIFQEDEDTQMVYRFRKVE